MESREHLRGVRVGGICGVVACVVAAAEFPLWFIGGSMPQFSDAQAFSEFAARHSTLYLSRVLMDLLIFGQLLVFFGGLRHLVVLTDASWEWLATIFFNTASVYVAVTLVSDALMGAIALDSGGGRADPSVIRALNESTALLFGSVGISLIATMTAIAGVLILRTGALSRWLRWLAVGTGAWNLVSVPTMYFGTDFTTFYSAAGDGPAAAAPAVFIVWIAARAVGMVRLRAIHGAAARNA